MPVAQIGASRRDTVQCNEDRSLPICLVVRSRSYDMGNLLQCTPCLSYFVGSDSPGKHHTGRRWYGAAQQVAASGNVLFFADSTFHHSLYGCALSIPLVLIGLLYKRG